MMPPFLIAFGPNTGKLSLERGIEEKAADELELTNNGRFVAIEGKIEASQWVERI